jgi:hypothetical protein
MGPAHEVLAPVPRRRAAGHLPELGGGLRSSPGGGQQGAVLDGGGDGDVRLLDRQGEVAGPFLRIADDRREPRVQLATPCGRDLLIDGGREQGVGEPHAVADDLDDVVLDRRTQATADPGRIGRRSDHIRRRRRQRRDGLERLEGLGGKPLEAVLDELLEPLGDRRPFAGHDRTSPS